MQNIVALHHQATAAVAPIIARARPTDLALSTPCPGWDLRALLEHMAGQDAGFAAAVRAGDGEDVPAEAFAPRPLGPDAAGRWADAATELDSAFAEAAAEPGSTVWLAEFGRRFPLETVVGFHLLDVLVHGWDVAAALGVAVDYDEELVATALAQAERVPTGPVREEPGAPFAPALPHGSGDPWERTLTLLGRNPMWAPATA